ncbi:MAG: hypothetical protein MSC30_06255 [Gaiellaceae bacterium MAG52_C11]|nr:hypothetical protein [Candidatus Gaiellasilicea maunaloa]
MPDERSDRGCESEVILDVVFNCGLLFLTVANIGDRPAHEVRIHFKRAFTGLGGTRKLHRLALFERLEFLAPRKSIEVFLDRSAAYFAREEPTVLEATITWRTASGEERRSSVIHDLEIYRDLAYIDREVPTRADPA